ncbi:hypothetical protein MC7420_5422 [Coleofasciculus chthonoplastes PCC 7420]|uniref:Collagen triple helix repeat protein n=1 Tax=Coleofasciculus chthonoplastes PCC 7420 TaxID=118168 RepID=B4VQ50_9CYAN|nr:hypothetical protein MC7420_5422 [Coleofasciculus chthonoplastes PCC 7420]
MGKLGELGKRGKLGKQGKLGKLGEQGRFWLFHDFCQAVLVRAGLVTSIWVRKETIVVKPAPTHLVRAGFAQTLSSTAKRDSLNPPLQNWSGRVLNKRYHQ